MMKNLFLSLFLFVSYLASQAQTTIYSQAFTAAPADWTASASPVVNFLATPPTPPNVSPGSGGGVAGKTVAGTTPAGGRFLTKTTNISTMGYSTIVINWKAAQISSFTGTMRIDYSTDGGVTFPVANQITMPALGALNTWTAQSVSLPATCENITNLRFRFAFISFASATRYYIDDIDVTGVAANQFYSKSSGSLDLLSSWTDDPTGVAGTSPSNFTADNQTFTVRNGNPGAIAANLSISGLNSKLIIEAGQVFATNASNSYTGTVDVNDGGRLTLVNAAVPTLGTLGTTSTVEFNSASSMTIPVKTYGNLTVTNAQHTLAGSISVLATLTINPSGTLEIGDNNTLTIAGTLAGTGYIVGASTSDPTTNPSLVYSSASSGTLNVGNQFHFRNFTISNAVTLTLGDLLGGQIEVNNLHTWGNTNSRLSLNGWGYILEGDLSGNGEFIGNLSSTIAIYNSFISTPLTSAIGFVTTQSLSSFEVYGRNVTLNSTLTAQDYMIFDGATVTATGAITLRVNDGFDVVNAAVFVPGTSTFRYGGSLSQTVVGINYNNLQLITARTTNTITLDPSNTINVAGTYSCSATFTGAGGYDVTGSTVNFTGATSSIVKTAAAQCVFNNLTISSGTLTDNTTTSVAQPGFRVRGDFTNNATFTPHATNPVIFDGTGAQAISGSSTTSFNNITASSTGTRTLTVSSPINVINDLTVTGPASGMFTFGAGGNVTLKSTSSSATARVAQITNPNNVTFTGNFNVERFALGGTTGYSLLGSPGLTGRTFADWDDDIAITCAACPDGYSVGGVNFGSIYTYSETVGGVYDNAARYVEIASINDPMNNGQGYWVYFGDGQTTTNNITLDVTGPIAKGNITIPLTLTGAYDNDHGWNLIANPYPSPISWSLLRNGNASVDDEIQVYNPDLNGGTGGYATLVGGVSNPAVGSGGIGNNIPMGQGFYVHTHANVSLTAQESNKTSTRTDLLRLNPNNTATTTVGTVFRLAVEGLSIYHDETAFHFNPNATTGWDQDYDATKWNNSDPASANISSTTGGYNLSINGLPPLSGTTTIPVKVIVGTTATYNIIPLEMNNLPSGACVVLHDNLLNADHDLRTGPYTCVISTSETNSRFDLVISLTSTLNVSGTTILPTCVSNANGMLTAVGDNSGPWNYYWKDSLNNIVQTTLNSTTADTLDNLGAGVYTVDVVTVGSCDNGTQTFTLTEPTGANALFNAPDTVYLSNGIATVNFSDASSFVNSYAWDFGDGSAIVTSQNPSYDYTNSGFYTVVLTVYNTICGDSSQFEKDIIVLNQPSVVGLTNNQLLDNSTVVQDQNDAYVKFSMVSNKSAVISVTDILGREVVKPITVTKAGNQTIALGLGDIRNQVLFINILSDGQQKVSKIVKN